MDAAQYAQLLAAPPDQRPAAAAGVTAYLKDLIAQDTTKVTVFSKLLPDSDAGRALVADIRAIQPPTGAQVLTGGLPSRSEDFMVSFWHSVPIAILIVVLVTGGVLFLTFGSIFLPVKAVLMSLISISASFGALVFVFQQGHLSGPAGLRAVRRDRGLAAAHHVRDPVRALHGLRGAPPLADPRAVPRDR